MTVKVRHFVRESGARRDVSEYVYDQRDLDANGNPPGWFLKTVHHEPGDDEIEFDHIPTDIEIQLAFRKRSEPDGTGNQEQ